MEQGEPQILELGAGSGKLAADILLELERMDSLPQRYAILEISADLRERQQRFLETQVPHLANRVHWLGALPDSISGAVIANEVLDALPVHLVYWASDQILERGVASEGDNFVWQLRSPVHEELLHAARQIDVPEEYLSEISLAARGLVASLCDRLQHGVMLFIDYGFGAGEYYHPQRSSGTLMCHYRHHAHDDPFFLTGLQDITAHVDFSAIAESAIINDAHLLGYTNQANFLINCGITDFLSDASPENLRDYLTLSAQLQKLTSPAEMGELFKVIALGKGIDKLLCGFRSGDKSRNL
jgi:SAM-dependent MidA family methyltransferase